jgi:hypothetical protein
VCQQKFATYLLWEGVRFFFYALLLTYSVLFIVPTQKYEEKIDVKKLTGSKLKAAKGMMNKTELDYAAMGILFKYSGLKQYSTAFEAGFLQ